jgi:hypothetical protein
MEGRRPSGQFQKGVSGNPKGRPKKGHSIAEQLRRAVNGPQRRKIIRQLMKKAAAGDLDCIRLVLAYTIGPPPREPLVALQQNFEIESTKPDFSRLSVPELLQLKTLMEKAHGIEPEPRHLPPPVIPVQPEPEPPAEETIPEPLESKPAEEESEGLAVVPIDPSRPYYDPRDPTLKENQERLEEEAGDIDLWRWRF